MNKPIQSDDVKRWLAALKDGLGDEHSDDTKVGDYEPECPVCVTLREMRNAVSEGGKP